MGTFRALDESCDLNPNHMNDCWSSCKEIQYYNRFKYKKRVSSVE